jgi:hypothetical protein
MNVSRPVSAVLKTALVAAGLALAPVAYSASPNLIVNGDFEAGNTTFGSDYGYSPSQNFAQGDYTVRSNPNPWNPFFVPAADHTTGSGQMLVGNGSPAANRVWYTPAAITVIPNTNYFFEAYVMNVCCLPSYTGANSPSILDFYANDVLLGTRTTDLSKAGSWEGLSTNWNSGAATSVVLKLVNANPESGGNDFAIDDIYLGTASTVVIPVPAALPLLASGLLAFGFLSRRRNAG